MGFSNKKWPVYRQAVTLPTGEVVNVAVPFTLTNARDPDVSFAFCFCGSIGDMKEAAATAARGTAKAQFVPPDISSADVHGAVARLATALPAFAKSGRLAWEWSEYGHATDVETIRRGPGWSATFTLDAENGSVAAALGFTGHGVSLTVGEQLTGPLDAAALDAWCAGAVAKCKRSAKAIITGLESGVSIVTGDDDEWD